MNFAPLPPPPPDTASSIALREIIELARHLGLDTDAALHSADIDPATLNDLAAYVPVQRFERVLAALLRSSPDPTLPLQMASQAQPGTFGIVSFIAMVAPTVADVVERAVTFERLLGDFASTRTQDWGENVLMVWDCRLQDPQVRRAMTEGVLAAWVVYARWLLNDASQSPLEILFSHAEPADAATQEIYARIFGAPVRFKQSLNGKPLNGIVVPHSFMALPLRQPDPLLFQTLDSHARQRLAGTQVTAGPVATRVAHAIRDCINNEGFPRKESVAARLEMNPRTMLRRLQDQGSTYQDVLDDVRRDIALELVRDATLSQDAIAARLGFAEIRSLQRCFRRWTGKTFADYRTEAQQTDSQRTALKS